MKNYYFQDYNNEHKISNNRILLVSIIIKILIFVLIVNLYKLQILNFKDYQTKSNENRIKIIPILPTRGIIYDRNGIPLAINRTIYQLEVIPEKVRNLNNCIKNLKSIVDLNDKDMKIFEKKRNSKYTQRFLSLPLKISLNDIQQAKFAVNKYKFPEIEINSYQKRYYPYRSTLTHVLGYVSRINSKDLSKLYRNGNILNYDINQYIGRSGIEKYYENILYGRIGYEKVEVNSKGSLIRRLNKKLPIPGKDIILTIDFNLQKYVENLLLGSRGAVVVASIKDGEILSLVSNPSYDPNLFVQGISSIKYNKLLKDKNKPLINRVTHGLYPPASTIKPYIAISALSSGIINKNFFILDNGLWKLPGSNKKYRDWKKWGHGRTDIVKAIEESADTFFYQLAYYMGIENIAYWMKKFGYGSNTNIDLPDESNGIMPTKKWKLKKFNIPWYHGDTISVGIGQGYWTATPIQMLKSLMILARDGELCNPHLLLGIKNNCKINYFHSKCTKLNNINLKYWKLIKEGMYGVANKDNGTASKNFSDTLYKVGAKSGTAQVYGLKNNEKYNDKNLVEHLKDHKLMIAFAPFDKPKFSIVVVLENGGKGVMDVGKITRYILDYIILNKEFKKIAH